MQVGLKGAYECIKAFSETDFTDGHALKRSNFILLIGGIMSNATTASPIRREPELLGQTVVVIGGSAGIGLEPA
jgi:hypothetical protein